MTDHGSSTRRHTSSHRWFLFCRCWSHVMRKWCHTCRTNSELPFPLATSSLQAPTIAGSAPSLPVSATLIRPRHGKTSAPPDQRWCSRTRTAASTPLWRHPIPLRTWRRSMDVTRATGQADSGRHPTGAWPRKVKSKDWQVSRAINVRFLIILMTHFRFPGLAYYPCVIPVQSAACNRT